MNHDFSIVNLYIPDEKLQQQGQTYFLLAIECILNWGEWYKESKSTNNPSYAKAAQKLINSAESLPDSFSYFVKFSDLGKETKN